VVGQRADAAEPASADLLARYEQLSAQFDGVAVARLENGACDGCHIQLSAVAIDRLAKASDDAVVTCEECGRLLVQ
jgi:predicted  nucleic acid-binding Zn-ribbon protein